MTINGIGPEWKAFRDMYHAEHDTKAIVLQARLAFGTAKSSGRYEVRNLQIEAVSAPVFPAYPLLTACAMLSEDGKALHLIVFNKSADQDISTRLHVTGFQAASSRVWEVNGSGFGAVDGVAETVHGDPLIGSVHIFPAHSMTAIDFVGQASPKSP
jgi:alpha-N-arabinofuranosidase